MNPTTDTKPEFELPQPQAAANQEATNKNTGESTDGQATEQRNMELPAVAPTAPPSPVTTVDPASLAAPAAPLQTLAAQTPITAATNTPDMDADDQDLIEKAWVEKAKTIVAQTKDDPYKQNTEISKVKKDYIQKRYHKEIKLSSE